LVSDIEEYRLRGLKIGDWGLYFRLRLGNSSRLKRTAEGGACLFVFTPRQTLGG